VFKVYNNGLDQIFNYALIVLNGQSRIYETCPPRLYSFKLIRMFSPHKASLQTINHYQAWCCSRQTRYREDTYTYSVIGSSSCFLDRFLCFRASYAGGSFLLSSFLSLARDDRIACLVLLTSCVS